MEHTQPTKKHRKSMEKKAWEINGKKAWEINGEKSMENYPDDKKA